MLAVSAGGAVSDATPAAAAEAAAVAITIPFAVSATMPQHGAAVSTTKPSIVIDFNRDVFVPSLEASDVRVDDIPATSFTLLDRHTASFTIGALGEGTHLITIAAGSVQNVDGGLIAAFRSQFVVDVTPPRVISTSVQQGQKLPTGELKLEFEFSEPVIVGGSPSLYSGADSISRSGSGRPSLTSYWTLYSALTEGRYAFRIPSGSIGTEDLAGNKLDGEAVAFPMPPNRSGDGQAGGDFVVDFEIDRPVQELPLVPLTPLGSATYGVTTVSRLTSSDDSDGFLLTLDAGQRLTVVAEADDHADPELEIRNSANELVATGSARGASVALRDFLVPISGMYEIRYRDRNGGIGNITVEASVDAASEDESHGGPSNDTPTTAQSLDPAFVVLAPGVHRAFVQGTMGSMAGRLHREVEPNDTRAIANDASASLVPPVRPLYQLAIYGSLSTKADVDFFALGSLQAADVLTVDVVRGLDRATETGSPIVQLLRVEGSALVALATDDGTASGLNSPLYRYTLPQTGAYVLRLTRISTSSLSPKYYEVDLSLEPAGAPPVALGRAANDTEPNDSMAGATDVSSAWRAIDGYALIRGFATGTFLVHDVDNYRFEFAANDFVAVRFRNLTSSSPSASSVKWRNATGGEVARTVFQGDRDSYGPTWLVTMPSTGTYYLEIDSQLRNAYDLEVSVTRDSRTPRPIQVDYFAFTAEAGQSVSIVAASLLGDATIELLDAQGNSLASGAASATNVGQTIQGWRAPAAGEYLVVVRGILEQRYNLVVLKGAQFDAEPNNTKDSAQNVTTIRSVVGAVPSNTAINRLFTYDRETDRIFEIDPRTGIRERQLRTPFTAFSGTVGMASTGTTLLLGGPPDAPIFELDPRTGRVLRTIPQPQISIGSLAFLNGEIFVVSYFGTGTITVLDYVTGAVKRTFRDAQAFNIASTGTRLLGAGSSGNVSLFEIDPVTGVRSNFRPIRGERTEGLGVIGEELFVTSPDAMWVYDLQSLTLLRTVAVDGGEAVSADGLSDAEDWYSFSLAAGERLAFVTSTPGDQSLQGRNNLDVALEIYDPLGQLVAQDDNAAGDGRNAHAVLVPESGGDYRVRVLHRHGFGSYLLQVTTASPPAITELSVASTAWTPSFRDTLASRGLGAGGYRVVPAAAEALRTLPWSNINQVNVTFGSPAAILASDLSIVGLRTGQRALAAQGGFHYDAQTRTATWTFAQAFDQDRFVIAWNAEMDSAGPGGATLLVLPGDVTRDGVVNLRDVQYVGGAWQEAAPFADANGSGIVDYDDFVVVGNHWQAAIDAARASNFSIGPIREGTQRFEVIAGRKPPSEPQSQRSRELSAAIPAAAMPSPAVDRASMALAASLATGQATTGSATPSDAATSDRRMFVDARLQTAPESRRLTRRELPLASTADRSALTRRSSIRAIDSLLRGGWCMHDD